MELIQRTRKAFKFASQDYISNMPDNVVTNILDRLPIQHAVRTSILSRNWRFKWTMLSQLVLDDNFFEYLTKKGANNRGEIIISRILLHIKGVIEKFVLSISVLNDINYDVENINHWILFVSTKGVKDITLRNRIGRPLKLSTHLFSCLELKHLRLDYFSFHPPASFHGFPNLLSLDLHRVQIESSELGEILTRCPSLEILDLNFFYHTRKFEVVDITKSKSLKILSLSLCNIDAVTISSSTIFELVSFLPNLQELDLDFVNLQEFGLGFLDSKLTDGGAIKSFPTACLKVLKLSIIDLCNVLLLSYVFESIRRFPNLQTLEITAVQSDSRPLQNPIPEVEYNTTGLRNVVFTYFVGSENEVCLIKCLLACSTFLEKIDIHPHSHLAPDGRLMFTRKLLKLRRASTVAEIDFH